MSAFVGLLMLDGTPCPEDVVRSMLERLRHRVCGRGWSGLRVRAKGSVGLGYAPRLSTPQALWELEQPDQAQTLTHNGLSLWLTSDVRLDNRAELAQALGLDIYSARQWSDGRFVLEAYARWGRESPAHLRGDFAFAVWDAPRHLLFCARDRFGTKPFYYAWNNGHFFAFANEIKALWRVPGIDAGVNETQIAHYLLARFDDKTSTFYRSVRRLSPASWMEIELKSSATPKEHLYWELDAQKELILPRDEDYAALLREKFTASVQQRMRSNGPFAVFLSGGLDSSSVAAVAEREAESSQRPIRTLSTVFDRFSECDEREFIDQTLARGEFAPLWLLGDDLSPLGDIERVVWHLDGPSAGPNTCSAWQQYKLLHQHDFSVVLDGHGGDEVVFLGYERVRELLRQGKFHTAWREILALGKHGIIRGHSPALQVWQAMLWHARGKRGLGRLLAQWDKRTKRRFLARNQSLDMENQGASRSLELLLSPELRAKIELHAPEVVPTSLREQHRHVLASALQPLALEILDSLSSAHGVESRFPFWQQEIVESCLSFPSNQKMRRGFNRYVMRQAMDGCLAPQVQWRPGKTDFAPQINELMRCNERENVDHLLAIWEYSSEKAAPFIAWNEVHRHWSVLQQANAGSLEMGEAGAVMWRVLCLGIWLAQNQAGNSEFYNSFI